MMSLLVSDLFYCPECAGSGVSAAALAGGAIVSSTPNGLGGYKPTASPSPPPLSNCFLVIQRWLGTHTHSMFILYDCKSERRLLSRRVLNWCPFQERCELYVSTKHYVLRVPLEGGSNLNVSSFLIFFNRRQISSVQFSVTGAIPGLSLFF